MPSVCGDLGRKPGAIPLFTPSPTAPTPRIIGLPTHCEVPYRTKNVESFEYGGNRVIREGGSSIPTASQSRALAIESDFFYE